MNALDILFVIVLGFFLFRGIYRGMILEIASIAGLVAGFITANLLYLQAYPWVQEIIGNEDWAQVVSYLGIFLLTMAVVAFMALMLRSLLRMIMLGWLDRLGGGVLGLIKAGLICTLALLLLTVFLPPDNEMVSGSRIAPFIMDLSKSLAEYLPRELREDFADKIQSMAGTWSEGVRELINNGDGQ